MNRQKSFEKSSQGKIYLVPTPIGNLSEISQRIKETLESADYIACEDTRNTGKLLQLLNIKKPLISHHEHNQKVSIPKILSLLMEGKNIAVCSDAGYPLISDPGSGLIQSALNEKISVISMSGPNAAINALVASGLECRHYLFYGFLDSKSSKRKKELEELKTVPYTLIFYEAPHRIEAMLKDMLECLGNRKICLARELTKIHEEYIRGTVEEVLEVCASLKGEMVVVVEGYIKIQEEFSWEKAIERVNAYIEQGNKTKQAVNLTAKELGCSKNELYDIYHKQKD